MKYADFCIYQVLPPNSKSESLLSSDDRATTSERSRVLSLDQEKLFDCALSEKPSWVSFVASSYRVRFYSREKKMWQLKKCIQHKRRQGGVQKS